jgi:hypothetical protein
MADGSSADCKYGFGYVSQYDIFDNGRVSAGGIFL